jgi:hypothetical protein
MKKRFAVSACVALALLCGFGPGAARAGTTLVVDKDHVQCPDAQFASIEEAVQAAAPGDTIVVCPDTYDESVTVDKPLTILGQSALGNPSDINVCSALQPPDPTTQAIVASPTIGFGIIAPGVVIDGFVIEGFPSGGDGIHASPGGAGFEISDNVIQNEARGVALFGVGGASSDIRGNCIRSNPESPGGTFLATGVLASGGGDVTLEDNAYYFMNQAHLLSGASNMTIRNNTGELLGRAFVQAFTLTGSAIVDNVVDGGFHEVWLAGGDTGDVVADNVLENGGTGIQTMELDSALTIDDNQIDGMTDSGIDIAPNSLTDSLIGGNSARENGGDGLHVEAGANSGNTIQDNVFQQNALFDCADDTVGPGTGGTANFWIDDIGKTENRPGLCS